MSAYFLRGPIYNGDNIMISVISGIETYYVCYDDRTENSYILSRYHNRMGIAILRVNPDHTFYDVKLNRMLLINDRKELNTIQGTHKIMAIPNKYAPWNEGEYLAGETYQLDVIMNNVRFDLTYFIPTQYHIQRGCELFLNYRQALLEHELSTKSSVSTIGFTNQTECFENELYTYCDKGVKCSKRCKGPCSNPNRQCVMISNEDGYECDTIISETVWYSQWFMWLLIVTIIMIIVSYVSYLLLLSRTDINSKSYESSIQNQDQTILNGELHVEQNISVVGKSQTS